VNLFTDPMFTQFFNQVTPENAGKWGSAAGLTRTAPMRWDDLDAIYDFAHANGFPLNFHVLVWGNQQPTWMASLPPDEQLAEIDQWFAAVAARYPDIDWIQVVNEPLHDPPDCEHPMNQGASCPPSGDYLQALGGHDETDGTGWDWVLNAFRLAREHFGPEAKLMINDYSITNSTAATTQYLEIIELLQSEGLIDAIGVQGHAFSTDGDMAVHEANLDRLAATGLPIQVTELDIDGLAADGVPGDEVQLADYRRIFPTFWEHPAVEGVTLWGWREPVHWRNAENAPIVLSTGVLKPAAHWLLAYVNAIAPVITPGQSFELGDGVTDLVGTVEADDWASQIGRPDLRTFTWQITGGTGAGIFAIESSTGEIRVESPELLDRNASPYSLNVRVSDGFHTSDEAEVTIRFPNTPVEEPKISVRAPNLVKVKAKEKQARLRFLATNIGDADSGPVSLCVKAPRRRLALEGKPCLERPNIPAGQTGARHVKLKVKPAARGKTTKATLIARGPGIQSQRKTVRVRVGKRHGRQSP
jgi:GH35 family endo-1,4-beta-xylanase